MEVLSSGGELRECGRGGMKARRYGVLEARCLCTEVEAWKHGGLEARSECIDVNASRDGSLEAYYRCYDMEG